jgi:precorrin-6x reductase
MRAGKVAKTALPPDLRGLSPEELQAEIQRRAQLRRDTEAEMARLARQRTEYLRSNAKGGEGGFDAKVNAAIDAQLK